MLEVTNLRDELSDKARRFTAWILALTMIIGGDLTGLEWVRLAGIVLLAMQVATVLIRGRITEMPVMTRFEAAFACAVILAALGLGLLTDSPTLVFALANVTVVAALVWFLMGKLLLFVKSRA